ncbi:hypothetical protein [Dactylosporangium sp. NPDC005555]|uniref:hypothetical protein n=1 Tax=Dactylosporangium sp. NPDC005555 TaxID=3154889 RepID=UPI0033ACDCCD
MRTSATLRATAVSLALSVCAMLLGLTHAHYALPGDMFQVARTASVTSAVPGADAPQGRKLPRASGSSDTHTDGPHWLAVLPSVVEIVPPQAWSPAAAVPATVHRGRCIVAPGCRGPPNS